jgi:hypothetical protein
MGVGAYARGGVGSWVRVGAGASAPWSLLEAVMVMRDWRERQVFIMLSMEYCADSVVGLEGGDTKRPACDLVVGAVCEPSQEKADGRSMMTECGMVVFSCRGLMYEIAVNMMTDFSREASLIITRVKALQYAALWLLLLVVRCGGCARAS